jgi:hypothetical protein
VAKIQTVPQCASMPLPSSAGRNGSTVIRERASVAEQRYIGDVGAVGEGNMRFPAHSEKLNRRAKAFPRGVGSVNRNEALKSDHSPETRPPAPYFMMTYQEKIAPPLAPLTDKEHVALLAESLVCEDRWLDSFIARLTDTIRDMKR